MSAVTVHSPIGSWTGKHYEVVFIGTRQGQADRMASFEQVGRWQQFECQLGDFSRHERHAVLAFETVVRPHLAIWSWLDAQLAMKGAKLPLGNIGLCFKSPR